MKLGISIHIVFLYINSTKDAIASFLVFQSFLFFNNKVFPLLLIQTCDYVGGFSIPFNYKSMKIRFLLHFSLSIH